MKYPPNGYQDQITRIGEYVHRPVGRWTKQVHTFLQYLRAQGFMSAPLPIGFDEYGREIVSFVPGKTSDYPLTPNAASTNALISAAKLLRRYHDTSQNFLNEVATINQDWMLPCRDPQEVICHGDFAPYNICFNGENAVGMIDFDAAHPGPRIWDIAYALYRFAPFTNPQNEDGFGKIEDQISRAEIFCKAYGLDYKSGTSITDLIIVRLQELVAFMIRSAKEGNKKFELSIQDGHHLKYLADIEYLKFHKILINEHLKQFFEQKNLNQEKITRHIEVIPYDPEWPKLFEIEATLIKQALGSNCIEIHHIGSTSVPGLAAKPKIDIITVIRDTTDIINKLEAVGYQYKGEYNIPFHFGFSKRGVTQINLHVYEEGNPEIELNILFRDYLRTHPDILNEYAQLKKHLLDQPTSFEKNNSMFTGYNLGKNSFIRKVLLKTGFDKLRILHCTHYEEWEKAKVFRQKYFMDKFKIPDPDTWTFDHPEHVHFVVYHGTKIIGYVHLQLLPEQLKTILRLLIIDEPYQKEGIDTKILTLCEKWIKTKGYNSITEVPETLNSELCDGKKNTLLPNSENFLFKPLQEAHFPLLLKWLQTPHVKEWWDKDILWTAQLIQDKYGTYTQGYKLENGVKKSIQSYIICFNGIDIGYVQLYDAHDFSREDASETLIGLPKYLAAFDIFIGEEAYIHNGLGSPIMKDYLEKFVDPFFEACFVDPDSENISAIRAYKKVGFEHIKSLKNVEWLIRRRPCSL